jgi:hypothetical protein
METQIERVLRIFGGVIVSQPKLSKKKLRITKKQLRRQIEKLTPSLFPNT